MRNIINNLGFVSYRDNLDTSVTAISGTTNFSGSVTITNSTTLSGSINISGSTTLSGSVNISGSTSIVGPIDVSIDKTSEAVWIDLSGSDIMGNGTISKPFRTINKGLSVLPIGTITKPNLVHLGAGTFIEDGLVVGDFTTVLGQGNAVSRVIAANVGSTIFTLSGTRSKLDGMSLIGISSGSNVTAIQCVATSSLFRMSPRIWNTIIRESARGLYVSSGSSAYCQTVHVFDSKISFEGDRTFDFEMYGCHAYQYADPRAPGTIGLKYTGEADPSVFGDVTQGNFLYLGNFESLQNEIAIQANGTANTKGGLIFGWGTNLWSEGTAVQINHSAKVDIQNFWSEGTINYDIEQTRATAAANMRFASLDFSKLSLIAGGEANVVIVGSDISNPNVFRVRALDPSFQLRDLNVNVVSGGLWRATVNAGNYKIERNTHVSGNFATFSTDFNIGSTGKIGIGDVIANGHEVEIAGDIALVGCQSGHVVTSSIWFYSGSTSDPTSHYVAFCTPTTLVTDSVYRWPTELPGGSWFLSSSTDGRLGWAAGSGGEANSGSNLGTGTGVYAGKVGIALNFKSLLTGSGITINSTATDIAISSSVSGTNLGTGHIVYVSSSDNVSTFKTIEPGALIGLSSSANSIYISSSAEINSGSNLGAGAGIYSGKTGVALEFKSLTAGANIVLTPGLNTIDIANTNAGEANSGSNIGAGVGVYSGKTGIALDFKTLVAGANIVLTPAAQTVTIDASAGPSTLSGANIGTGIGVYSGKVGDALEFKTFTVGPNLTISSGSTTLVLSTSAEANTAANLATDYGLYASKSGAILQFKSLAASGSVTLISSSTAVTVSAEVITASNAGTGTGIFKSRTSDILNFYSIEAPTSSLAATLYVSRSADNIQLFRRPRARTFTVEDDFTGSTGAGAYTWTTTTNGTGALVAASTQGVDSLVEQCVGVIELRAGTPSSGRAAISSYASAIRLDAVSDTVMEWRAYISNLSVVALEYRATFGWMDNYAAGDQVNAVYFEYDRLTAEDFWRICSSNGSSRSKTTTAVAVQTATYSTFRIETNSGCTLATYYINNVSVGTLALNLPTGAGKTLGFGAKIEKTAGTGTTRSLFLDYFTAMVNWPDPGRS